MNLRRRRRVQQCTFAAFLLTLLAWAYGMTFETKWVPPSNPRRTSQSPYIQIRDGTLAVSNNYMPQPPGWFWWPRRWNGSLVDFAPTPGPLRVNISGWPPGSARWSVYVNIPLWIPPLLLLPPLLLARWSVLRSRSILRRGLCHSCGYDLTATPQNQPCSECGSPRFVLPPPQRHSRRSVAPLPSTSP